MKRRRATYDERVRDDLENAFLVLDVVHVLALDDFALLHGLYRKLLFFVIFKPSNLDISECA